MKREMTIVVLVICGLWPALAWAAEPAAGPGVVSPFDKNDPEIQQLRALSWKGIDFDAQDLRTRSVSLLALNDVLGRIGGKADARLDLLVDYFEQEKLGEAYAAQMAEEAEQKPISFEDARKVAVAFLKSPMGDAKFGDDFEGAEQSTLKAYERLYDKSARSAYAQAVASRLQVASMGTFLQKQGKFSDFAKWAAAERQRRQEAYEKETAEKRKTYLEKVQIEKDQQAAAYAEMQAKRRAAEEAAAGQMEKGIVYQEGGFGESPASSESTLWVGDSYWPWRGAYYATGVYRGAVADKARNAYRNWNGGRIRAARGRR